VTIVHRRDKLRASKIMQEKAKSNPKISFIWNSAVKEVLGTERVEALLLENVHDHSSSQVKADGLFLAIGHEPLTSIFKGQLELDEKGYIKVHEYTKTSVEGIFAAGDVQDVHYRQAVTAAGSGCQAAIDVERYLEGAAPETMSMYEVSQARELVS
jgi:thioredoxin reductase (NADPH)